MFNNINAIEQQDLKDAIAWITVLIAGADGNIDTSELDWASKLTNIRSYSYAEDLKAYYASVGEEFESDVKSLINNLPEAVEDRTKTLSVKLASLNSILCKMDNGIAFKLYESYLSFAEHVAKASGGFLRFATVSKEEKSLMHLEMINPIILEIEEEEDFETES